MSAELPIDREIALPRSRSVSQFWRCAMLLAGLGIVAVALDVPLAAWVHKGTSPSMLYKVCGLSEAMGHGVGVLLIALVIAVLDPWHRYRVPRILAAALGSGLLANIFKLLLARTRPNHFDFDLTNSVDSFGPWLPLLGNPSWNQGFPSSHAATAAGLAIVLSCLYPRGRVLFLILAVLAGMQRVLEEAHFASDVFWGAAVGCLFAPLCVYGSGLARAFDQLEQRLMHTGARPDEPGCGRPADLHRAVDSPGRDAHQRPRAA